MSLRITRSRLPRYLHASSQYAGVTESGVCMESSSLDPGGALGCVLELDAKGSELGTNAIGLGKILGLLGSGARLDARPDGGLIERGAALQVGARRALKQAERSCQRLEQACRLGGLAPIYLGGQFEEYGDSLGRVEVFVHRGVEASRKRLGPVDVRGGRCHGIERGVQAAQGVALVLEMGVAEIER